MVGGYLAALAAALTLGATECKPSCSTFPSSPFFTDQTLHQCTGKTGMVHIFTEPMIVDGFYTIETWLLGTVPSIDEVDAVEVLGGDPPRIHYYTPSVPFQIVWKARGGDDWQPASRKYDEKPTEQCDFQ